MVLRSSYISMDSRLELIDFAGELVEDISDRLMLDGSSVSRDATGQVAGTAVFQLSSTAGIDFGRHLLRLHVTVADETTRGRASELILAETNPISAAPRRGGTVHNLRTAGQWTGASPTSFTYQGVTFTPSPNVRQVADGGFNAGIFPRRTDVLPPSTEIVVREADSNRVALRAPISGSAPPWSNTQFGFSLHFPAAVFPAARLVSNRRYRVQIVIPEVDEPPLAETWPLGVWVPRQPGVNLDHTDLITVECQDTISLLTDVMGRNWSAARNTNVGDQVRRLLDAQGLIGLRRELPRIDYALVNSPNWELLEELTWLDVANEILGSAAHSGLHARPDGTVTSQPWTPLDRLPVEWDFDATRTDSWIAASSEVEADLDRVPNRWVAVITATDSPLRNRTAEAVNNEPSSRWSVPSQGGRTVTRQIEVDAPVRTDSNGNPVPLDSAEALEALRRIVRSAAEADTLRTRRVRIECGPLPLLWHAPVVSVHAPDVGVVDKLGVCREWQIPLDAAMRNSYYLIDVG